MDCHSSARISSKSAIVQNKQLQGPRSSGPCKSKMNSLLDATWPARGVGETRPPNGRPAALARRSVQDSGSRSTQRELTATTHIERRADSPEGCRAARSDSFRGPSPLKPRFISHSQSQRTTNERAKNKTTRVVEQIEKTQAEPQWIVAQRLLSALTIPGFK